MDTAVITRIWRKRVSHPLKGDPIIFKEGDFALVKVRGYASDRLKFTRKE